MRTKFAIAAVTIMAAAPVFAQTQTAPPSGTTQSPTTTEQRTMPPAATPSSPPAATAPLVTAPTEVTWYSRQPGEARASSLIGATVRNNAREQIGDINDLVIGSDGKVVAAIIGVGGFLGIGERLVAVSMDSLAVQSNADGDAAVVMNATRDSLKQAPEWKWGDQAKR